MLAHPDSIAYAVSRLIVDLAYDSAPNLANTIYTSHPTKTANCTRADSTPTNRTGVQTESDLGLGGGTMSRTLTLCYGTRSV